MKIEAIQKKSTLKFLLLLIVLSLPFWLLGVVAKHLADWLPINLPISALMAICPIIAAIILVYKENGASGIRELMRRTFDYKGVSSKIWYLICILMMPFVLLLSYIIMRLLNQPLPAPHIQIAAIPIFLLVFFIAAIAEEVGWTGYIYEPMLKRWSALKTGILIGAIWGIWHVIPLIQADNNPIWIIWQVITSIFNRILMIWIYNNSSKNIFLGVIYHMMINVSVFLFPNYGSHYNPVITSIILGIVTTIVTFLWGSKTLAQYRLSKR
ncbi:MAG: hypothetical protein K0Q99_1248 [Clostridia bacterium]|jgi:membrane protease YdiL (CAAX protease family)|nr:hypothetical protein [Clostridia bacterium]